MDTGAFFPPIDPAAPLRQTAALADAALAIVRTAHALADAGRAIDLDGLERMVGRLCAGALDLPPEQGRQMRPRLVELRASIDALTAHLAGGRG